MENLTFGLNLKDIIYNNIEKDFLPVFKRFYSDEKLRTCPISGEIMETDPRFVD